MASKGCIKKLRESEYHQTGEANGCIFRCSRKGHIYRENGYEYAKNTLDKWYKKDFHTGDGRIRADTELGKHVTFINKHRDPRSSQNIWHIGDGKYGHLNYRKGYWPYTNQAHHILPIGALIDAFEKDDEFYKLQWLLQAKYNINIGLNIIILPTEEKPAKLMQMLTHPSNHPKYSKAVENVIKKIKSKFSQGSDPEQPGHKPVEEENMPELKEELDEWSYDQLIALFIAGYDKPAATVNDADVFYLG